MINFKHALQSRDFLKLWGGQIISGLGDRLEQMGIIALFTAAGYHSVTAAMALIAVLVIAPHMLISPIAGWVVDRVDRRYVMIASDLVRAVIVMTLPFTFPRYGETAVYASVLLLGLMAGFFNPAKSALIPRLVPDRALQAANGLSATTNIIATMIGSFIGGHLAHSMGVDQGRSPVPFFLLDMASYFVSAGLLWRIVVDSRPQREQPAGAVNANHKKILPFIAAKQGILAMLFTASLFWAVAAAAYSAINSFAYVRFGGGVAGIGNMQAALGLGMLLGAVIAGRRVTAVEAFARHIWPVLLGVALTAVVLAGSYQFYLSLLVVMLLGALGAVVLVLVDTGLQRTTPDELRGRVFGIKEQLTSMTFVIPSLVFYFDPAIDAHLEKILYGCAALLVVTACWFLAQSWVRILEANHIADWGNKWLNRLDGLNRLLCRRFHRLQHEELLLPKTGGALVVANHVSGLDPLLMIAASPRPLRFMIAQEEYDRWWLKWLFKAIGCIPVGRESNPRGALKAVRQALEAGEVVALFPYGGIHLDHEPPVALKRGVMLMAEMTGVPVCPLRVEGVRGQGKTVSAVFLRSRARIFPFHPLYYKDHEPEGFLRELGRILSGK